MLDGRNRRDRLAVWSAHDACTKVFPLEVGILLALRFLLGADLLEEPLGYLESGAFLRLALEFRPLFKEKDSRPGLSYLIMDLKCLLEK